MPGLLGDQEQTPVLAALDHVDHLDRLGKPDHLDHLASPEPQLRASHLLLESQASPEIRVHQDLLVPLDHLARMELLDLPDQRDHLVQMDHPEQMDNLGPLGHQDLPELRARREFVQNIAQSTVECSSRMEQGVKQRTQIFRSVFGATMLPIMLSLKSVVHPRSTLAADRMAILIFASFLSNLQIC